MKLEISRDHIKQLCCMHISEDAHIFEISKLGGLTNKNFKVATNKGNFVFRFPGVGTEKFINRKNEYTSTVLANQLNIDAELVNFDVEKGIKISKYIKNAETMNEALFKANDELIESVANIFRTLHGSKIDTCVEFNVFKMIKEYEDIVVSNHGEFWADYNLVRNQVSKLKEEMEQEKIIYTPCHNDPLCENFIRGEGKLYLTDWEYAGMNDPIWDIADFIIEAELDEKDQLSLVSYYDKENKIKNINRRVQANKVFVDFLWALWALMKNSIENNQEMLDWSNQRYSRAKKNLEYLK